MFRFIFLLLFTLNALANSDILKKVDDYRGFSGSFEMKVKVLDYDIDGKELEQIEFKVLVKNAGVSFLEYKFPKLDKGKMLLMKDENIWFYSTDISKPLRISPNQRLLGNVSNADVAHANFSYDYYSKIISEKADVITLELNAKRESVMYGKIILKISAIDYKPISGEFFAATGKLLKTANYTKFTTGKLAKMEIYDGILKNKKTVIEYSAYKERQVPDYYFNPEYLPRLK